MFIDTKVHCDPRSRFIGERIVSLLKELHFRKESEFSISIAPLRGVAKPKNTGLSCERKALAFPIIVLLALSSSIFAQNPIPNTETLKKANARPADSAQLKAEPFDGASIEKMTGQCVTVETEQGTIVIEMLPAKAPETVRGFLNLASTGALET